MAYTIHHKVLTSNSKNSNFIDQFTDLLTEELPKHQDLIIMGDINIHMNDKEDHDAQTLLNTLEAFNLKQHVNIPTHNQGHTLDLIITPATYQGSLVVGPYISDHRFITLETLHIKPKPKLEKRTLQKFTNDTALQFINEFNNTPILESTTLDMATEQLNNEMLKTIEKTALASTKTITSRHKKPWYDEGLKNQRRIMKNRERKWIRFKEEQHWKAFKRE